MENINDINTGFYKSPGENKWKLSINAQEFKFYPQSLIKEILHKIENILIGTSDRSLFEELSEIKLKLKNGDE